VNELHVTIVKNGARSTLTVNDRDTVQSFVQKVRGINPFYLDVDVSRLASGVSSGSRQPTSSRLYPMRTNFI
jgi:hypothetical protein